MKRGFSSFGVSIEKEAYVYTVGGDAGRYRCEVDRRAYLLLATDRERRAMVYKSIEDSIEEWK